MLLSAAEVFAVLCRRIAEHHFGEQTMQSICLLVVRKKKIVEIVGLRSEERDRGQFCEFYFSYSSL